MRSIDISALLPSVTTSDCGWFTFGNSFSLQAGLNSNGVRFFIVHVIKLALSGRAYFAAILLQLNVC